MISNEPFTEEECREFLRKEHQRNKAFAISCIIYTAIICAFCFAMAFVN